MKGRLIIVSFCSIALFSFTGGEHKKHKTSIEYQGLKGKVKSWKVLEYNTAKDGDNIVKGDSLIEEKDYVFNEAGNETETWRYLAEDRWGTKTFSTYDTRGYCTEAKSYRYTATDTTLHHSFYKYNEIGNRVEGDTYTGEEKYPERFFYKYDDNGNQTGWYYISGKDTIPNNNTAKYDEDGNLQESDYYVNGKLQTKTIRTYDGQGKFAGYTVYYPDESIKQKEISQKDTQGNLVEYCIYKADGSVIMKTEFKIEYDWAGNKVKEIKYENGKAVTYTEYVTTYYN